VRVYVQWHPHNKHKGSMYKPAPYLNHRSSPYQLELLRIRTQHTIHITPSELHCFAFHLFLHFTFSWISPSPGLQNFLDFTISWISPFPVFHNFPDFTLFWISQFPGFHNFLHATISWISHFAGFNFCLDFMISLILRFFHLIKCSAWS